MSNMMDEDDIPPQSNDAQSNETSQPPTQPTSANVNPVAMEIIQTNASNFTEATVQNPEAQQNMGQIITNYVPMTSTPLFGSSPNSNTISLTTETTVVEKMEEVEPQIRCVICFEDYAATAIAFNCTTCKDGKVCTTCMAKHVSTWKIKALQDCGPTIDTGQQTYFVYSNHILSCPACKTDITPGIFDPSLAWYKKPSFPPSKPGKYAVISSDNSSANLDCHSFKNGYGQTRYFNDYPAYILALPKLPGDCPHCGDGAGNYVRIKAKNAATVDRDPWRGGAPSCLICPAARNFGPEDDLFYCAGCHQSILHPSHFNTTGQVEKGTFYTVVFQ